MICPDIATPQALVQELGDGQGRSILCPVPKVMGLREPDVVPSFWQPLKKQIGDRIVSMPMKQRGAEKIVLAFCYWKKRLNRSPHSSLPVRLK